MSQENVEIVRRFYEAGQRSLEAYWKDRRSGAAALETGDLDPETEAVLAFLHPEVEYGGLPSHLEGGVAHGHLGEEILRFLTEWRAVWEGYRMQVKDASVTTRHWRQRRWRRIGHAPHRGASSGHLSVSRGVPR
jgi:hypothetical protein